MKTAIICHGGGMKAAFTAGVVYSLSKHGIKTADLVIGTSSGVPTACYFVSKQFSLIKDTWGNKLGTEKLIKASNFFKGKPIFNLNYLVDTVFRKINPLNVRAIKNSKTRLLIPLYNYKDRRAEYWSNHNNTVRGNFWDILKVSMAIHDKLLVHKDGLEKFTDIDLVPFAIYKDKEIFKDITHFIIISSHKDLGWSIKKIMGHKLFIHFQTKNFPKGVKEKMNTRKEAIQKGVKVFNEFIEKNNVLFIKPRRDSFNHLMIDKNKEIRKDFKMGEKIARLVSEDNKDSLKAFINRSKQLNKL